MLQDENLDSSEQNGLEKRDYLGIIPFYRQKTLRTTGTQRRWNVIVF